MTTDTPMLLWDDTPRTRTTDPVTSHIAADISQKGLPAAKLAVLHMFNIHGRLLGSELNAHYELASWRIDEMLPRVSWDSPRKRASELERDGFLMVTRIRKAEGSRTPEREFTLTDAGRAALVRGWVK